MTSGATNEILPSTSRAAASATGRVAERAAISIQQVSKTYPIPLLRLKQLFRLKTKEPVQALQEVSFDVREGEVFGLIGRNGAGKTTLAKIIATLVQPTSGAVNVRGFDSVRDEERVRAQIGLASAEERSFYWRLTVEENLIFFARLYGLGARATRQRIDETLQLFEMGELRRRRFGELSTGNKQRLAVARALLGAPPVLLLDEPTRSLDPVAAARMRALIASFTRATPPVSVLLTSHNLAEVEELCDRVAIIARGRIRAVDAPPRLRAARRARERVHLSLRNIDAPRARRLLEGELEELEVTSDAERLTVTFARDEADALLDRAVRLLTTNGAVLVACDTERNTLFEALESYEREDEGLEKRG